MPRDPAPDANIPNPQRRSDRSRQAILDAAWELLDADGLRGLTIDGIAQRAGVGKATIYRWWPNKAAVAMDALQERMDPQIPFPDTGSTREDLRQQLCSVIELHTQTQAGRAYRLLIGESQHDPELATALAERYIASRRGAATAVLERGIARGELRADLDPTIAIDAIYGAVYYRLLVSHTPTQPTYADQLLDQMFIALRA